MNVIRGIWNRILFLPTKFRLKKCGTKVLFESTFEVEGAKYITIGNNFRSKPRFHIAAIEVHNGLHFSPDIIIGNNVSINYDVHIACIDRIEIGDGTLLASKVFITDHNHGDTDIQTLKIPPQDRKLISKGPVVIGKNVWIGENVCIMPGVVIGDNCIIGANSVVTNSIPAYTVSAGVPAKIIKKFI
ncbi:MAG: acyltransferase [Clostridia bacterium]|nr:acyltransferase [Clostridia bacterium]